MPSVNIAIIGAGVVGKSFTLLKKHSFQRITLH